jgi:hypothetical protein
MDIFSKKKRKREYSRRERKKGWQGISCSLPSFIIRIQNKPWPQNRSFGILATYFILHLGPLLALKSELSCWLWPVA